MFYSQNKKFVLFSRWPTARESCVIGVAAAGKEISTGPFQLVTGRQWKRTAFGGWKSRGEVPGLVQTVMRGEMDLDPYITHTHTGLAGVNQTIEDLHGGSCLRYGGWGKKNIT